jgi:hypothetical protein
MRGCAYLAGFGSAGQEVGQEKSLDAGRTDGVGGVRKLIRPQFIAWGATRQRLDDLVLVDNLPRGVVAVQDGG